MKKILVVYNTASGRLRPRKPLKQLVSLLRGMEIQVLDLQSEEALMPDLLPSAECVCIIGGDGTVRSMVQRLVDLNLRTPIAIIPRGSGNLLAKTLHLPASLRAAARLIKSGKTCDIDIARLDTGEYFVSAFAAGFLSHGIARTTRRAKKTFGIIGYLASLSRHFRLPSHAFTLTADGTAIEQRGNSVLIISASRLFGMHARRVGKLHDGIFEGAIMRNRSSLSFPAAVRDFYFKRSESKHFVFCSGRAFTVAADEKVPLLLDGEQFPARRMVEIAVIPRRQPVIVPRRFADSRR